MYHISINVTDLIIILIFLTLLLLLVNLREKREAFKTLEKLLLMLHSDSQNTYSEITYKTDKEINMEKLIEEIRETPTSNMLQDNDVSIYITVKQEETENKILIEFAASDTYRISTQSQLEHVTQEMLYPLYRKGVTVKNINYSKTLLSREEDGETNEFNPDDLENR